MKKIVAADIVIFGGGVAGLWLLNRLRQAGLAAILLESGALGGGQTHKAQGIIHGGMKYALQGVLTPSSRTMADIPRRWRQCLQGQGEIDLSGVPILSPQHYLFSPHKLTAKLTAFFAGAALQSKIESLQKEHYPAVFRYPEFKGEVYALDEIVIDVPALIRELVKANQDVIFQIEPFSETGLVFDETGNLTTANVYLSGQAVEVHAQRYIFAAGSGNEVIVKRLSSAVVAMQRRPLHMVLAKVPASSALYAHCLGLGTKPRITITTHAMQDGQFVWYLGGQLAEEGIKRDSQTQIKAARAELIALFPWLDFSSAAFATFMIDRAEPLQPGVVKPDSAYVKAIKNMIIAWPTKLALAPRLADEVMQHLQQADIHSKLFDTRELRSWPMPPLANPIWEEVFC